MMSQPPSFFGAVLRKKTSYIYWDRLTLRLVLNWLSTFVPPSLALCGAGLPERQPRNFLLVLWIGYPLRLSEHALLRSSSPTILRASFDCIVVFYPKWSTGMFLKTKKICK